MPFGIYAGGGYGGNDPTSGGAYTPNAITDDSGAIPYSTDSGATRSSPGGFDYSGATGGGYNPSSFGGQNVNPMQDVGAGASFGPWGAIIGAAVGSLQSRLAAQSNANAARAAIPSPAYTDMLRGMVDQMAREGADLKASQLGPNASAAAGAVGARAAAQRGLSGPLAASVATNSVNQAQQNYNQWRMQALQASRQQYLGLVQEYLNAMEKRRQAMIQSGYADRESTYSYLPLDPFVLKPLTQGIMNATGGPGNDASIQKLGAYNYTPYTF
jgi:hypothetical protein